MSPKSGKVMDRGADRLRESLRKLNKIGAALSQERQLDRLLEMILASVRDLVGCDAGSLYLVQKTAGAEPSKDDYLADKELYFKIAQNDSVDFAFKERPLKITKASIAGYVALTGQPLNITDVRRIQTKESYRFNLAFDKTTGYRSLSMLAVPMQNLKGELLGVLQLINCRASPGRPLGSDFPDKAVLAFDQDSLELALSLAGQAAISIENNRLYQEIQGLFDSFVHASVTAIESRDPTTSGHSERVGKFTTALARAVDRAESGPFKDTHFSADQLREIEYASLLHDFGKIGVREEVLIKAKKLYPHELDRIERRGREVKLHLRLNTEKTKVDCVSGGGAAVEAVVGMEQTLSSGLKRVDADLEVIRKANDPTVLDDGSFEHIRALAERPLAVPGCDILTLLDETEAQRLGIRRGSLSPEERREIESHVTHTYHYLKRIPWPKEISRVPEIAYGHHEQMNGKGYPQGLKGEAIPLESRMMTIADIYDALTAWDRPYKKAVPVERALGIIEDEAKRGAVDAELLRIFIEAKIYDVAASAAT